MIQTVSVVSMLLAIVLIFIWYALPGLTKFFVFSAVYLTTFLAVGVSNGILAVQDPDLTAVHIILAVCGITLFLMESAGVWLSRRRTRL